MMKIGAVSYNHHEFNSCAEAHLRPTMICSNPGYVADILFVVLKIMNVHYSLTHYNLSSVGTNINHSWTGLLGQIQDGSMDTMTTLWVETPFRRQYFSFSLAIAQLEPVFVTKKPPPNVWAASYLPFTIFDLEVWAGLIASFSLVRLALLILKYWDVSEKKILRLPSNIFAIILGLSFVLFSNLYKGRLLTQLMSNHIGIFRDSSAMMDLIARNELSLVIQYQNDWLSQSIIHDTKIPYFQRMKKATKNNPVIFESNTTKILEMLDTGKYVLSTSRSDAGLLKELTCNLNIAKPNHREIPVYKLAFLFSKSSPWLEGFNHGLVQSQEHSEQTFRRHTSGAAHCPELEENAQLTVRETLNLITLSGVFMLFAACLAGCCAIFIGEKCLSWRRAKTTGIFDIEQVRNGMWRPPGMFTETHICVTNGAYSLQTNSHGKCNSYLSAVCNGCLEAYYRNRFALDKRNGTENLHLYDDNRNSVMLW